jgi:hypothetical protein
VWADHHTRGRQHREHLGHTNWNHGLGDVESRTWLFSSYPNGDPRQDHTDPQADNKRHDSDPKRVHTKIVGVGGALSDQLIAGDALASSTVWHMFTVR